MSLEPGGRSDKYGNNYENRYLAKLLLRLVKEELTSVTVEPLGENSNSVEFISEQKDGTVKHYQCKASNTTHSSWSISDLRKYKVFQRAKEIIAADIKNLYYFISPLQYNELDELCKRARTNSSPADFVTYQLTNTNIRSMFNDCVAEFGLDISTPLDVEQAVYILSHCYFEQYITGTEADQELNEYIGMVFTGKASIVRVLLEQYANDTACYGVKITAKDVIDYLEAKDIHVRNYHSDRTVLNRISVLNNTHWDSYHAIHETLIHRTSTDSIVECIKEERSVVLHGKAGTGKSGCLEEIILYLKKKGILYLSVKLDKHLPHKSADAYGEELGLPESPVYCLATLSAGKPCVLIMDQLDALRWTSNHSRDALDVCKELILQAEAINKYSKGKISIIFASRTFDLENDKGLKELFAPSKSPSVLRWVKVNMDHFTKDEVIQIIGQKYDCLTSRLQKLLLTPSSLYVWSKLEEDTQKNSISSVFELMDTWWQQIQQKCISVGLQSKDVASCKNKIVMSMESRAIFSLPQAIFIDQANEIDFLVSLGLLNYNSDTKSISFTHQSFLDYFITADILKKIYSGYELKDLIGDRRDQTPLIRYRLLTVLQNLLESDFVLFAKQSSELLESSSVRFYFKCAVFEIISQCETPASEIYQIIDEYIQKPEWSDYITQVVFYGHPSFIMRLKSLSGGNFPSDSILLLLKSINYKQSDFVTDRLLPFSLKNPEQDRKIFWTLCHDANDDSDNMFKLRVRLLQKNPTLFHNFFGFHELIKRLSARAIDLFEVLIESWPSNKISNIYISDADNMTRYAKQYAWQIVTKLFPQICEITANYLPRWPHSWWNNDYQDWTSNGYHESAVRSITEIVKDSFAECAQTTPEKLITFVKRLNYPISAVGHECIMHAILNLPISYADEAIEWLLTDIDNKIFVFSVREDDFLSYTKQFLQKFTSLCDLNLFRMLEQYICAWKEPVEHMLYIFRERREVRETIHTSVYYAYWGHFQKALLQSMDISRLSVYSKQLLDVVNRNPWIQLPYFYSGFTIGDAKFVVSPVENYTERLSDKTWLQIISTPQDKMSDRWSGSDKGAYHVEANHVAFASALGKQAKREPLRFTKLALSFPENCYEGYVSRVLYAFDDNTEKDEFDVGLVSKVIRRYGHSNNSDIAIAVSRIIKKRANEVWPDDIINIIEEIALNHPHPSKDEYSITSNSDSKHKSAHSLLENSINCARGCALHAIAALLWEHCNLGDRFKSTILSASNDPNDAVRFAVMSCALPYYNIEKDFAVEVFNSLIRTDLRIISAHGFWDILSREYDSNSTYYREVLIEACLSEISDLAEHAAGLLCAVAIYHDDQDALNFIMTHQFSDKQQGKICLQAVSSFDSDEHHEKSKIVLMYLIDHSSEEMYEFNRLFFDQRIAIERDEEFLIHLMESHQGAQLIHSFLDYLYESDKDICSFARVINAIGNSISQMPPEGGYRFIVNDLVKCIVCMFDKGKEDPFVREICLDIWDKLFRSNLHDIKPLSDMIDDFE